MDNVVYPEFHQKDPYFYRRSRGARWRAPWRCPASCGLIRQRCGRAVAYVLVAEVCCAILWQGPGTRAPSHWWHSSDSSRAGRREMGGSGCGPHSLKGEDRAGLARW